MNKFKFNYIFTEIMECNRVLSTDEYEKDYVLIDEVLFKMRNKIAHGDNLESLSLDEVLMKSEVANI